jgi:DNA-binding protein HU-beta
VDFPAPLARSRAARGRRQAEAVSEQATRKGHVFTGRLLIAAISCRSRSLTIMAKTKTASTKKKKHMTKSEVHRSITESIGDGISAKHVKAVLEHLVELGHKELSKVGVFVLHGLAKFVVVKKPARPAREGINPFTKQKQKFAAKPASKTVRARPVKAVKDAVS